MEYGVWREKRGNSQFQWISIMFWLVVPTYPSEKYEFVSWEYEIPNTLW